MIVGFEHAKALTQYARLRDAGCVFILTVTENPDKALRNLILSLNPGDTLIVPSLGDMSLTLSKLMRYLLSMNNSQISFIALDDKITAEPGSVFFEIVEIFARVSRKPDYQRTEKNHRSRGRQGGRKPIPPETIKQLKHLYFEDKWPIDQICLTLNIHKSTLYKYLNHGH